MAAMCILSAANIAPEIKDKLVEHLNEMLSAENAAVDRLDSRIQECLLPEGKQQLQHHQDETRAHQERLRQIITDLGGSPTDSKADLPTLRLPTGMLAKKTLTDMAKSITGGRRGRYKSYARRIGTYAYKRRLWY